MIKSFDPNNLKKLYIPPPNSHKGQNGKLMIIGGSKLFHGASLWSLKVASRILDMVYYSSVPENNAIVQKFKEEFRDGIIVPRNKIENYIKEADCILIGPGLPRKEGEEAGDNDTRILTETLLKKYPQKKWVIDGGSLQTLNPEILKLLKNPILTPHAKEFEILKSKINLPAMLRKALQAGNQKSKIQIKNQKLEEQVKVFAEKYNCTVVLKGPTDIVCPPASEFARRRSRAGSSFDFAQAVRGSEESSGSRRDEIRCARISGGNAGMTKGGTGDVLAGLAAALYCKNDAFLSAACASYINKKAGESLFGKVGYYFNSSDLVDEIPRTMKRHILNEG